MKTLTLTRPDDWHLHLRDGAMMSLVLPETARVFARGLVMPNLKPPVINANTAMDYRERILAVQPPSSPGVSPFCPLMALYLTPNTTPEDIYQAAKHKEILAMKWYPAGATTNSAEGVSIASFQSPDIIAVIEAMQEIDMVLCIHGEVVDDEVDIFDRERVFIDMVLAPLLQRFPRLRVVLEHITSSLAVDFISHHPATKAGRLAASITVHHLSFDRNAMLVGGIRPHYYCLPILKRRADRQALISIATSGHPAFFLGTDSAPHTINAKESACGCAGAYTAPVAMPLLAQQFEAAGKLPQLNDFTARFGADFYRQPINHERLVMEKSPWQVPSQCPDPTLASSSSPCVVPFLAKEWLSWRVLGIE